MILLGLRYALLATALGALAASSAGCSLIGLGLGSLSRGAALVVLLDDSTEVRGHHAVPDTAEVGTTAPETSPVNWIPRGLVVRRGGEAKSPWLSFDSMRSIGTDRGDVAVVMNDGSRLLGAGATVEPMKGAHDPAAAATGGLSARSTRTLVLARPDAPEEERESRISLEHAREVRSVRTGAGAKIGLCLGLAIDVALVVAAIGISGGGPYLAFHE
jgi:hypothetical protein